uniref:Trissin receptor-like n=1 Tax=Dermatophagoides pteronyssinus TaxID=6956 RepID=A0A6P6YH89_DERPT|nr:trissin receptor-like [Dermatophagoides pteronyssinus]
MNHTNHHHHQHHHQQQQQQHHHNHHHHHHSDSIHTMSTTTTTTSELDTITNNNIYYNNDNNDNNNYNYNINKMNETDHELLELLLGPVRDPLGTVVPMSILYIVLLTTGTIGNVCTCIVIAHNRYMHTATNFYLFSLAISDLLLLILGLPQELFLLWQKYPYIFGEFFCVVRGLSSETSTNASILTITAFTVERYVAICHPLKSHTMSQLPRAIKTILVIWAVSAICALPVAWQFGIIFMINKTSTLRNISRQCGMKVIYMQYGFETSAIVFFLVPITLITILYVLIGINLRRSSQQHQSIILTINREHYQQQQQQQNNNNNQQQHYTITKNDHPNNQLLTSNALTTTTTTTATATTSTLKPSSSARELSTMNYSNSNQKDMNNNMNSHHHHSNQNLQNQQSSTTTVTTNHRSSILYQRNNSISSSYQKQIASRRSVIRMLVAVVIAFFFCYSPFHAQRVLATSMHRYKIQSSTIHYVYVLLTHISGITYYLSATINPILYQLMSRKFRLAFKDTFGNCCPCWRPSMPEITYNYMNIVGPVSGGGSTYQLNRIPSFQNNYQYRRPSSFTNIDHPTQHLRNHSSMKSIHSFDPIIISPTTGKAILGEPTPPRTPSSILQFRLDCQENESISDSMSTTTGIEKNIDQHNNTINTNTDINQNNDDVNIAMHSNNEQQSSKSSSSHSTTTTTLVKFKQFLEVPSVKF